ncbi:MAG: phosphoenolpyruvate--protein phosphotransferase [Proteobacteria bacterium]|nr:phosphoenolpyruvate--protein phosphotransferase [Pseudomonadota bacterium]
MVAASPAELLSVARIRLASRPRDKGSAIAEATQLLIASGCVAPGFEASVMAREDIANTYLGHGVAIPHGLGKDRNQVLRDGLAIVQIPQGVEWNPGQRANLVVAIAAQSDNHIAILRRLTRLIQDEQRLQALFTTPHAADLLAALGDDAAPVPTQATSDLAERIEWMVRYPAGLHARPASVWVEAARKCGVRMQARHGGEVTDARNLVGLLGLGLRYGQTVTLSADGEGARAALESFRALIDALTPQEQADAAKAATPVLGSAWSPPGRLAVVPGIAASPGLAMGTLHILAAAQPQVPDLPGTLDQGADQLNAAIVGTQEQLTALADDTARRLGAAEAGIFRAQRELLKDSDLITLACQIMVEGHGAAWSWNQAVERMACRLAALGNPVLAGRASDLRDVGRRVLARLEPSVQLGSLSDLPDTPCIVVADDLSPSDTAAIDMRRVVGLAIAQGGPTSHTAILARTLGLPAIVGAGATLMALHSGTQAIIDGAGGKLYIEPGEPDLASARDWIARESTRRAEEKAERSKPARTSDGHTVAIGANVNLPDQVPLALHEGAEGVGLMRTEFLFLERGETPDEDAQFAVYRGMIDALDGRPLIVRALDIGGDKQVAHLQLPQEANPFLGVRGARLLLRRPDLLQPQLRALYRAAKGGGDLSIMFPMVTSEDEVRALRAACELVRSELGAPQVPIGIMIEVPAAAIQADLLAAHVDFFSIGTNDLTQYTLAMDRQNPELAPQADSLHPAVLRLIRSTVEGASRHGRWVGVCGGIAGDPFGATLLAGLGVHELSMTPRDIPGVKARMRASNRQSLEELAARALASQSAQAVRALDEEAP